MSLDHYDAPSGVYSSSIPPGTQAFRSEVAAFFGYTRTEVVRDYSRCRKQKSEHCECGAIDFFTTDCVKARKLFDWCEEVANPLGLQSVISCRRVVGFGDPDERHYSGPSPHTDHVHIGLNRWARRNLTREMVRALLPGQEEDDLPYTEQQLRQFMEESAGKVIDAKLGDDLAEVRKGVIVMMKNPHTGKSEPVSVDQIVLTIAEINGITVDQIAAKVFE